MLLYQQLEESMNISDILNVENKIFQIEKKFQEEEKLLSEARSKYNVLIDEAYKEGAFKLSLGKLKETIANYCNIPSSQINLLIRGRARLLFAITCKRDYRDFLSSMGRYSNKVKIWVTVKLRGTNSKASIFQVNFYDLLKENEEVFSKNGYLNDLRFVNGFDDYGKLCSAIYFSPECIENIVVNIHPRQLDAGINCDIIKYSLFNYLKDQSNNKEL